MSDAPQPDTPLFAEFGPASDADWVAATIASLKGKPIDKLTHLSYEGIPLKPLLGQTATAGLPTSAPGQFPYRRGTQARANLDQPWHIAQQLEGSDPQALNAQLRHDLAHGQTAVCWTPEAQFSANDIRTIFAQVDLTQTPLFIAWPHGLPILAQLATARRDVLAQLHGGLLHDPLAHLAKTGNQPLDALYDQTAVLTRWASKNAPRLHTLAVMPSIYQESGAHAVQELGLMLATAVHHIRQLQQRGVDVDLIGPRITAVFSIGSDFFMEIAKLRAARNLWAQMMAAFGGGAAAQKLTIHAQTSASSKSELDPHVNLLRATTEAFAAALGGADSIAITPFDAPQHTPSDFSRRIARNVHLILQDEVNLAHLLDPAGGSYTVEYLTEELAQRSWAQFQQIEAAGGVVAALLAGTVQQQLTATAAARQKDLATRKAVMVGTNMYPNLDEKPLPQPETKAAPPPQTKPNNLQPALAQLAAAKPDNQVAQAIAAAEAGATLGQMAEALAKQATFVAVERLRPFHPATPFAQLRHWADEYAKVQGHPPQIFLANMGPLRQHKARADFTRSYFEVGGFAVIDSPGFDTPEAAAHAALEAGAKAIVICSTDETYPTIVPPLAQGIKAQLPDAVLILAGYPKDQIEALKAAGIDAFIHLGADCLAHNQWLQEKLGS